MFILASKSPRRKEILSSVIKDFKIIEANIDERRLCLPAYQISYELSKLKAYDVFAKHPDDVILACDTVVIFNGVIFNKPKDEQDAFEMLSKLSDNHHVVLSSYTLISKDFEISNTVRSDVYFNKLSPELIKEYIKTGSPLDKAGAYGIQDKQFNLVNHIDGSYFNIMGLPIEVLTREFKRLNLI